MSDAPLPDLPEFVELDFAMVFARGEVRRPADLTTTSGVLAVLDLGYVHPSTLAVLTRRVPPGTYPVEVVAADGANLAVRVVLSDALAVTHRPAPLSDGSMVIGVDGGNVALVDAVALSSAGAAEIEAAYLDGLRTLATGEDAVLDVGGAQAVMVTSGYGDGGYSAYWGLGAAGDLVELVVDFHVAAERITRTTRQAFVAGEHDGLRIERDGDAYDVSHPTDRHLRWRVLAPDGSEVADGRRSGTLVTLGRSSSTWMPVGGLPEGAVVEVTEDLGYRHV